MRPPIAAICGRGEFHRTGLRPVRLIQVATVVHVRKPVEIIAGELWDHEDPDAAAEDVITALEEAGWRLVWVPDSETEQG